MSTCGVYIIPVSVCWSIFACRGGYDKGQGESWYTENLVRFSQKTFIPHLYS